MAEILPQVSPFTGNKYADWGGPWDAPSTNDLINFGSLLKDNWGTIRSQGPGVIKSYAEDLNPMNYIDLTPVKQFFSRPDSGLEEQPIWNPDKPESEWEMPGFEFDTDIETDIPQRSIWERAIDSLMPSAWGVGRAPMTSFNPPPPLPKGITPYYPPGGGFSPGGGWGGDPSIPSQEPQLPQIDLPSVHYPDYVPSTRRVPHHTPYPFNLEDRPGLGEFSLDAHRPDVTWTLPDILESDYGEEGEFSMPVDPVVQYPTDRHPDVSSPPQIPQVVSDDSAFESAKDRLAREARENAKKAKTADRHPPVPISQPIIPPPPVIVNPATNLPETTYTGYVGPDQDDYRFAYSPYGTEDRGQLYEDPWGFEDLRGGRR